MIDAILKLAHMILSWQMSLPVAINNPTIKILLLITSEQSPVPCVSKSEILHELY